MVPTLAMYHKFKKRHSHDIRNKKKNIRNKCLIPSIQTRAEREKRRAKTKTRWTNINLRANEKDIATIIRDDTC